MDGSLKENEDMILKDCKPSSKLQLFVIFQYIYIDIFGYMARSSVFNLPQI